LSFSFGYNEVQLGFQFCQKIQLGFFIHLKPFLACSFQVAGLFFSFSFFYCLFILKEGGNFRENSKLGYDSCPLITMLTTKNLEM